MSRQFAQYWFTHSREPHWRPRRDGDYNQLFLHQLEQLHHVYQLTRRRRFGVSDSDYLREVYVRGHIAYVKLAKLDWGRYTKHEAGYITIFFNVDLELYLPLEKGSAGSTTTQGQSGSQQAEFVKVMALPFRIQFGNDYPTARPSFDLHREKLKDMGLADQRFKWDQNSYLCVMNNANDWVPGQNSTMVNAVDCLVDWMAANHFNWR